MDWSFGAGLFCSQTRTMVKRAIDGGRLAVVEGEWKVGRVMVRGVLDQQGQAQFYGLSHAATGFKACPQCPHA